MANHRSWIFTENPFLNATDNSFRLAIRISSTHLAALKKFAGDPFFNALIAFYEPLDLDLNRIYNAWKDAGGEQQGSTLNLNQLLRLLMGTKIRQWDIGIQNIYGVDTQRYKALLPHRRTPFQTGSQTDRRATVQTLSDAIGDDAALALVKADVNAFYTLLSNALSAQKGDIHGGSLLSKEVEMVRVAMCTGQYANLGALMQHYAETPDMVASFFDMVIRSGAQVLFTGDDKPQEHKNIFKHTFSATDMVRLENDGVTEQYFYLAANKTAAHNGSVVIVPPGQKETIPASQLGDVVANTFLNVFNPDAINKGEWTVEIE